MWDGTHAIGIDLGTTYSSVAVLEGDSVVIIPNEKMNRTSSCVAFTDTGRLMGNEAKNRVLLNPENTIFGSKRMIGRKFDDPKIQQDMENWQFKVVNECGMPKIRPQVQGETKTFAPEEIIAMVLREMRKTAERYLVEKVMHAVISVPACFNDSQRQATINAAKISGLKFIWLITEPAAAALACMVGEQLEGTKNVLIFDLGGGTLDVSVIEVEGDRECKVKSTAGDNHLGGEDFDSILVAHFVEEFKTKHQKDLRTCPKALQRLRIECEYAKRILSSCFEVNIYINCLFDGINFHSKLTRLQFEDMCMNLFLSIITPVKRALFDAEMAKGSIDEVVLVGGSTRIPMIREMLKEFFDGKEPFVPIVPFAHYVPYEKYEAVAFGAAVCASVLRGLASSDQFNSYQVIDVASFSLLLETREGVMTTLIHRNSQIPCEMSKVFSTDVDNQSSIDIDVYEGEQAVAEDNRLLGRFCIEGIPQVAKGVPQVEVKFQLDSNGILDVSAESSEAQSISVIADKGGFSVHEIDKMMQKARRWIFKDYHERKRNNAREELISYAYSVKLMVEYSSDDSLTEGDRDRALEICDYFLDWMEENPLEELIVIEDLTDSAKVQLSPYIATMDRERYR